MPWLGLAPVREIHLDAAWAPLAFDGPARSLIHALKFRGALGLAHVLAGQLAERAPPDLLTSPAQLVAVPAHPGRARRRGFDTALLLTRALASRTGLPVARVLVREGTSGPGQRGAGRAERLAGERLGISARGAVHGRFVLVDDVWTTGATLRACAAALRMAGTDEVSAVAYARVLDRPGAHGTIAVSATTRERSARMRIDVKGLNVPVSDELRSQIERRFATIAKQVSETATLDVILAEERNPAIKAAHKAEGNLHVKGVTLNAKAQALEMRTAVGEVAEELQRQLTRRHEKVRGHRKVGTPTIRTAAAVDALPGE